MEEEAKRGPGRPPKAPTSPSEAPTSESTQSGDIKRLEKMVGGLMEQFEAIKNPRHGLINRTKVKEHTCTLREFTDAEGKVKGIVTRLYSIKEVKDPTEAKRFMGQCKLDVLDPRTNTTVTEQGVDYLEFLNNARPVACKIQKWEKTKRSEVDKRRGGGGVEFVRKINGDIVPGSEIELIVEFMDEAYELEILDGEYRGLTVKFEVTNQSDSPLNI